MEKTVAVCPSEFEAQAQKIVSLAYALCESRITANNGAITLRLRALSAATVSLEKAVAVFMAVERLSK